MRRLFKRKARGARSLRARLVASAVIFLCAAILVVGLVLQGVLDRIVRGEIASRLELQISTIRVELLAANAQDLSSSPSRERRGGRRERRERDLESERLNGPPFDRKDSGWFWQVETGDEVVALSRSLDGEALETELSDRDRGERRRPPHRLEDLTGLDGQRLLARTADVDVEGRRYRILATAPLAALQGPLREATATVALVLLLLGAALVVAIIFQVRFGLAPVEALRRQLAKVREGDAVRVDGPQPAELAPLVHELNALIDQEAINLRQARLHVANLAHGLKTPLATLSAAIQRQPGGNDSGTDELLRLTELMDRRIRHHLRRAQTVALGESARRKADLATQIADLTEMLRKFHSDSPVIVETKMPSALYVAVDPEDLDEMLGNLLDNAFRHARAKVSISYERRGRDIVLRIADDGRGLTPGDIAIVRQAGRRLDESLPGHGFGLPITIEIVEIYGGRLELGRADEGGLEARLYLPAAEPAKVG